MDKKKIKAMELHFPLCGEAFFILIEGKNLTQEWERNIRIALTELNLGNKPLKFTLADGKKVSINRRTIVNEKHLAIAPVNQVGGVEKT